MTENHKSQSVKVKSYTKADLYIAIFVFFIPFQGLALYGIYSLIVEWNTISSRDLIIYPLGIFVCTFLAVGILLDILFRRIIFEEDFIESRNLWKVSYVNSYSAITKLEYVPEREIRIRFNDGEKITLIFGDLEETLEFLQSKIDSEIEIDVRVF